ncbi:MAG: peroxidase-related enzyme [Rhodospirillaceae bacterium]|nr:peroxidase-related enzyme [Rhodospirillaceae bacterium]
MPQPKHVMTLPAPNDAVLNRTLDEGMKKYFNVCREKLGMLPNVLRSYAFRPAKLRNFVSFYNELMLGESKLTKLEREMIAVVVSSTNHCYYCLVAHGQAVRELSGDPELGEMLAFNYRVAELTVRHKTMLDFAYKLTVTPATIDDEDRRKLRTAGFSDEEIFDIADTVGFYNMSNRVAIALDMMPNPEYHARSRAAGAPRGGKARIKPKK